MTVRTTKNEHASDLHAMLDGVRQGVELVIEQDDRPVAVLKSPQVKGRNIPDVIVAMESIGANAVIDEDFARDVEAGIGISAGFQRVGRHRTSQAHDP